MLLYGGIVMSNASKLPLSYKGRPLMRKDNMIYYGSMADKYIIYLQINSSGKKDDLPLSEKIKVELQLTDPDITASDRVVKSTERTGLYNAMDIGSIWLERALSSK